MLREKIVDWLFRETTPLEQKQLPQAEGGGPVIFLDESASQSSVRSVRQISQYGYIENINVYRAVNILADACGSISWDVFKGSGKNKIKQDETHPLSRLLIKPNKDQAGATFIHKLVAHWILAGTIYQFAAFPGNSDVYPRSDKTPSGLYLLHPMLVEPQVVEGQLMSYRYQSGPKYIDYPLWKVLPLRFFHPLDELSGISPIMVAALVVERQNEGEAWNFALMKHAARPSGAFVAKNNLGEVAYSELKAEIRRTWGTGKRNAGYPIVLDNGLTYVQMALSPMDADWNTSDTNASRKIATAIGVDPLLLNDKEHSSYNNVREARLAMIEMTVIPIMDRIRDEWNGWLCPWYGDDVSVDYDKSQIEILRGNRALYSTMVSAEWNVGLRSFNESTEDLKLGKIPDTDDFYKFAPTVFVRKNKIAEWLDQQESNRGVAAQGLIQARQVQQQNGNNQNGNSQNGNKPEQLTTLASKGDALFHTFQVKEIFSVKLTQAQKNYYDEVNQERDVWAEKMSEHLSNYFDEELAAILSNIDAATTLEQAKQAVDLALQQHSEALPHVLVPYYLDIAESSKNRVIETTGLKSFGISIHKKDALSDLANYASSHITNINESTREKINDIFLKANTESISPYEMKAVLQNAYGGFKTSRAMTIARTEVLAASNLGGQIAMRQTGLPILKTWLATQDGHTREWHAEAGGQQQKLDDVYYVNGEELMFPGDTSLGASADNVINCRCCETYQLDTENLPEEVKQKLLKFNPYHDHLGRFASGSGLALNPPFQSELPGMGGISLVNPHAFVQPAMFPASAGAGQFTEPIKPHENAPDYPEGDDISAKDTYLRKMQEDELYALDGSETDAIAQYSQSGYKELNRKLRNGEEIESSYDAGYSYDEAYDYAAIRDGLDSVIAKNIVEKPITVYRGVTTGMQTILDKKVGKVFTDKGFVSTSASETKAGDFGNNAIMRIKVPAGAHGAYLEPYTEMENEYEFLLPRGSRFKILEHTSPNYGYDQYVVDMLPEKSKK